MVVEEEGGRRGEDRCDLCDDRVYRKRSVKTLRCKNRVSGVIRSPASPSTRVFPLLRASPLVVALLPLLFRGDTRERR